MKDNKLSIIQNEGDFIEVNPKAAGYDEEALHAYYNEFISSADASYSFRVKKERQGIKGYEHCFTYSVSDYTFPEMVDKVAAEYGAGSYRLMVYTMRNKLALNQPFHIASKVDDKKQVSIHQNNDSSDIAKMLLEQQSTMIERLENAMKPKQSFFTIENLPAVASAVASIAATVKLFMPERQAPMNPLDMMKMIKEIQDMAANNGEEQTTVLDAAMKALDTFGKPLLQQATLSKTSNQLQLENENKQLKLALENAKQNKPILNQIEKDFQQEPALPNANELDKLKNMLSMCVKGAIRQSDPLDYALIVLDQLEDDEILKLIEISSEDLTGCLNLFKMLEPQVENHIPFFTDLLIAIRNLIDFDEEEEKQEISQNDLTNNQIELTSTKSASNVNENLVINLPDNKNETSANPDNNPASRPPRRKSRNTGDIAKNEAISKK